jgi:hypothetical protein
MLISPEIWQNRSLLNKFRRINSGLGNCYLTILANVITASASTPLLQSQSEDRLRLIYSLHLDGCSNREIADYFNRQGVLTPNSKSYSAKLIWLTLNKYKERLERLKTMVTIKSIKFHIL